MATIQQEQTSKRRGSTALLIVAVVVVVFVLAIVRWVTTPYDDYVPVTPQQDLPASVNVDELPDAAHYRCSSAFDDSTATATDQATEAQTYQALDREPCASFRTQRKVVTAVDLVVVVVALLGAWALRRRRARAHRATAP